MSLDAKLKHLEMIQGIVNRLAGNLFYVKGWSITLVAGLFALTAKDENHLFMALAYLPLFVFWVLDAYFLSRERSFRALYDHVATLDPKDIDFSMNIDPYLKDQTNSWVAALTSKTIAWFYAPIAAVMLFVIIKVFYY